MKFYCRHWYSVNLILSAALGGYLFMNWSEIPMTSRLVALNLAFLFVHQFEEYGWPGGGPMVMNYVLQGSNMPEKFPLNQFSAMFTNVITAILFYGLPFFFPELIGLCLAPMLFNIGQVVVHGIATNKALKGIYNPGLGAVIFLHLPTTVYFLYYVYANNMIHYYDWIIAIGYTALMAGFGVAFLTYAVFADKNTKWAFAPEELERFDVIRKVQERGIVIDTSEEKKGFGPIGKMQEIQKKLHP